MVGETGDEFETGETGDGDEFYFESSTCSVTAGTAELSATNRSEFGFLDDRCTSACTSLSDRVSVY
ncbi:hypothetical protein EA473_14635 [Natrarchaeobius chitinivorans]|uniref:Uncharacterized protein n=1 Tax=Natrarchaeobius chitinivorans TaxID=1679083 RepID=A0A3N6LTU7_NATCH|nr:hypothetical protein EA473_14635 [Natrarchaeobius chitinivorans]